MLKIILNNDLHPLMFYDKKLIMLFEICDNNKCLLSSKSQNQLRVYLFCHFNGLIYAKDDYMIIYYKLCIYFVKQL